jgi:hypothetical protein
MDMMAGRTKEHGLGALARGAERGHSGRRRAHRASRRREAGRGRERERERERETGEGDDHAGWKPALL